MRQCVADRVTAGDHRPGHRDTEEVRLVDEATEANLVGKRYRCATCGTEVMCVKGGTGRFRCHDTPMELLTAKPLPSSD